MNTSRSVIKIFFSNLGVNIISFLAVTIFARKVSPAVLGTFFLFQAVLGVIAIPADFGINGAIQKRLSEGEFEGSYLGAAVIFKIILATVLSISIYYFKNSVNNYIGYELAIFLIMCLTAKEFFHLGINVLKGELRVGETATINIFQKILWFGFGLMLIEFGLGVKALVFGLVLSFTIVGLWTWYKKSTKLDKPQLKTVTSLFTFSKYNSILSTGGLIYNWTDVLVIGLFLSQAHVGIYEIAWRVSLIPLMLSRAISTTIFPQVSNWEAEGSLTNVGDLLSKSITPSFLLVIPAFFGIFVISNNILSVVFGQEYSNASTVLIILMVNTLVQAAHSVLGTALSALDRPDLAARATVISVIGNGILNIVLVWEFGLIGAASATVLSAIIGGYLHVSYLFDLVEITIPYDELGWCVFSSVIMIVVLYIAKMVVNVNSLLVLGVFVVLGASIYASVLIIIPQMRSKVLRFFRNVDLYV